MSDPQRRARDAIASQLIETLDRYEGHVAMLCGLSPDCDDYSEASRCMDEMRLFSAALPPLSVPFVALLISHAELVQSLWARPSEAPWRAEECRSRHRECLRCLRERALRLVRECA